MARVAQRAALRAAAKRSSITAEVCASPPVFIEPQLCKLVTKAPFGPNWVHEQKFDGYRMAARIDHGQVQLLTRSGLDWTAKYPETAAALAKLPVKTAYIDGELCAVGENGVTSFALMQAATDRGTGALVYYAFDLMQLNGEPLGFLALGERKERLRGLLKNAPTNIQYSEHLDGDGEAFRNAACKHGLEGVVSKLIDKPYMPGNRGVWVKSKCLNRAEFVIVGWTDPEGARQSVGALLLGYYTDDGRLLYAGRVGTGMSMKTLGMLYSRLKPIITPDMPLSMKPPRKTRFGSPLELSRVHWVQPQLVAEITYLTWTDDGLLRHTVFVGLRDDKAASEVRREPPVSS